MSLPILTAWLVALAVLAMPTGFFWCCCSGTLTVCVRGCGTPTGVVLSGVTVTIKQGGSTVATDTTGGGGCVSFTLASGSYSIEITGPTGYANATRSTTVAAAATTTEHFTLSAASGYHCCGTTPIPNTIYMTTAAGSFTMSWTGTAWLGSITISRTDATATNGAYTPGDSPCVVNQTADVTVAYQLTCGGQLTETWNEGCTRIDYYAGPPVRWECVNSYYDPMLSPSSTFADSAVGNLVPGCGFMPGAASWGTTTTLSMSSLGGSGSISGSKCLYPGSVSWTP